MNITSVIIQSAPQHLSGVCNQLGDKPGVEVHISHPDGTIVVTVEQNTVKELVAVVESFHDIDNVLCVTPCYHHFDDTPAQSEVSA